MGRILLSTGRYAGTPYHMKSIGIHIYSVEELCYLLSTNPFLIDTDIMDKELVQWLDEECGLTELCHQLLTLFRRGSQPSIFANTILDYVNSIPKEDRKKMEEVLQSSAGLNDFERHKKQGDYLIKNGRYKLALTEYERLLSELPEEEKEISSLVYHNMGVAYSRLFQFESAAKYFGRAYERSGREESGIAYLTALRRQMSEGDYITFIGNNGQYYELSLKVEKLLKAAGEQFEATRESRMLTALSIYKEEGNTVSYYEEIDKIISDLKKQYRECVAQ